MMYVLMGFISATAFGIGAFSIYGYQGLMDNSWIDYVFWWLIGTGIALGLLDSTASLRCRLCRRAALMPALCPEGPCP